MNLKSVLAFMLMIICLTILLHESKCRYNIRIVSEVGTVFLIKSEVPYIVETALISNKECLFLKPSFFWWEYKKINEFCNAIRRWNTRKG